MQTNKSNPKGLRAITQYEPCTKVFVNDNFVAILSELNLNPEYTPVTRGIGCREITNLSIELTNPLNRFVWNKARDMNYEFAMKFFLWMLNGDTDFSYVAGANANAKNFQDAPKDDKAMPANFSTAYGPRIQKQLPYILEELARDKESRRAVIHILNEGDLDMLGTGTKEEYPCTDSCSFMIRDNKLHMYTHMRSNNMVLTLCYDMFNFTMFHEYVMRELHKVYPDLELGTYHHNIMSAHYFDREQELVNKILTCSDVGMSQKKAKVAEQTRRPLPTTESVIAQVAEVAEAVEASTAEEAPQTPITELEHVGQEVGIPDLTSLRKGRGHGNRMGDPK
jgi:thymidylate synthase